MYIWKYKYNSNIYDTRDEMFATFGELSPMGVEYDYENMIAFYTYREYSQEYKDKVNLDVLKKELLDIKQWYTDTDYIPLKVFRGNWNNDDPRYLEYLVEYDTKQDRQNELEIQIATLEVGE